MAIAPAGAQTSLTPALDALATSVAIQGAFSGGNAIPASTDYVVRSGYVDLVFKNTDTAAVSLYIVELMVGPGESSPYLTNGLQDAASLNKFYTTKRHLGLTRPITIPPGWSKVVRIRLSKTTVLTNNGYSYSMLIWSDYPNAANSLIYKFGGGRCFWDRVV